MSDDGDRPPVEKAATGAEPSRGTLSSLIEEIIRGSRAHEATMPVVELRGGDLFGRYELRRELGRGGFGVVWEARDRELGRAVAVKVLRHPGEEQRERRLLDEAEVAARLSHPNIVTVLDVGRARHGVFLVQEYLVGRTLAQSLAVGRTPLRETLRISIEIARGLAHAHTHGVVHRDLSAQNVFLCDDGQVKVLDLGMAAALGRRKLQGGTPDYMAPEQAAGAPEDERTDVYALGVLLFKMLTGQAPFARDANGRPRSAARGLDVPEAPTLGLLVESMLASDPVERPRDASLVLSVLQECLRALPERAAKTASRARVRAPRKVRWWLGGLVAGIALAALGVAAVALWVPLLRPGSRGSLVLAAGMGPLSCDWRLVQHEEFDAAPAGARSRNGEYGGQQLARREERGAWLQSSDWSQLFVPLRDAPLDTFAIDGEFWMPPTDKGNSATLYVFADPVGPLDQSSSNIAHGRGLLLIERPGNTPIFEWGIPDGMATHQVAYQGVLGRGSLAGRWHVVRIEGSRAGCWLRASLDGQPILSETGHCDFSGAHVVLGSQTASYTPAEVAWRALHVFAGAPDCR